MGRGSHASFILQRQVPTSARWKEEAEGREHSYLLKRLCPEPVFSLGSAIRLLWASVCLSVKWGVDRDREAAKKVFKVVFVGSPNSHEGRWLALLLPARVLTDKPILVCP